MSIFKDILEKIDGQLINKLLIFEITSTLNRNLNMNQLLSTLFVLLSFSFLTPQTILAQTEYSQGTYRADPDSHEYLGVMARRRLAYKAINDLKRGTLIVRFISNNDKIEHYKKKGNAGKAKEEQVKINAINKSFMDDFISDYNYSDVVFCYGVDIEDYLEGKKDNIFLNEALEIDPSISIKEGPMLILGSQSTERYYLYDTNFVAIPKPAPSAINPADRNFIQSLFESVLEITKRVYAKEYLVETFNANLHRLHAFK